MLSGAGDNDDGDPFNYEVLPAQQFTEEKYCDKLSIGFVDSTKGMFATVNLMNDNGLVGFFTIPINQVDLFLQNMQEGLHGCVLAVAEKAFPEIAGTA